MTSQAPSLAPVSHLVRPEKALPKTGWLDQAAHVAAGWIERPRRSNPGPFRRFVRQVSALESEFADLGEAAMNQRIAALRLSLPRSNFGQREMVEAFAVVREMSRRTLGLFHFESQLFGGCVLLRGCTAEMATGEGKTLTATLPACVAALAGVPVHVVSVNDYLTERDAEKLRPLYEALGISVGVVIHGQEPLERRANYGAQVTYCTNKELVFDYLKDQLVLAERRHPLRLQADTLVGQESRSQQLMLRGLHFAIVDEVDSILVDEARTPLVISQETANNPDEVELFEQALELARGLKVDKDYKHDAERRHIELKDEGRLTIEEKTRGLGIAWTGRVRRDDLARQALSALLLFERDRHYLIRDGKVQIIDEYTGRIMEDRSWEGGLHQLIEMKEGCELTKPKETLARISYQRFFRRYRHFAGMTGTAEEIRAEFWSVYGMPVVRVPLNRKSQRIRLPDAVCANEDQKWRQVVAEVERLHRESRPVLIGTRTVEASEILSELLTEAGLAHEVLNAKQDETEAEIVAHAGQPGQITVATNMAGRGTDIELGIGVPELGGLHVILTERHESSRIDRQLEGRCARQGDPGSFQAIVSLEDFLVQGPRAGWSGKVARAGAIGGLGLRPVLGRFALRRAQRRLEKIHARFRKELVKSDDRQGETLAFAGPESGLV